MLVGAPEDQHRSVSDDQGDGQQVLVHFFERRQTEPISTSLYAVSIAPHTCRIMAPGPMISGVSNMARIVLPYFLEDGNEALILLANSRNELFDS